MPPLKLNKPFAKKSFGQNFLVDENYIGKIISALNLQTGKTIVEIGAGRGALTEKLISSGAKVSAVELEREMISVLREQFAGVENFQLIESDALKINFENLLDERKTPVKLVANLPYYISTAILQNLIEQRHCFSEMILMFQNEVVERITARTGSSERGFLTVLTETYLDAEKLFNVPPNAFRPAPKVLSAVVKLIPKTENTIKNPELFRQIISAAFVQKRKTILNNLKAAAQFSDSAIEVAETLKSCQIDPTRRAETLSIEEWKRLYETQNTLAKIKI